MGLKILSICGGLETGLIALKELGIPIDEYHTYEIYKPAIDISSRHHPEIIHHGDVIGADFSQFAGFDLVIAGTCCQSLSVVRQENRQVCSGLEGKSSIFFEFARAIEEIKPRWFMLENVVPKNKSDEDVITSYLKWGGCKPVLINSNLFSAQDRQRLYWTNIPIPPLPENNDTMLRDVMVDSVPEKDYYAKPFTFHGVDKKVIATLHINTHDLLKRVYNPDFKCATLTCVNGGYQEKKVWDRGRIRKLSPIEYERLQTLPDNYTEGYSDNVRRSLCGNGWTKDVIKHIFIGLKQECEAQSPSQKFSPI